MAQFGKLCTNITAIGNSSYPIFTVNLPAGSNGSIGEGVSGLLLAVRTLRRSFSRNNFFSIGSFTSHQPVEIFTLTEKMHIRSLGSTRPTSQQLVSKVLSQAVKLWLRSQVEQVDALEIEISGSNRSILTGHIPRVTLGASSAVYQGLHLSQVDLCASEIDINIGQVLKGRPLQLLKPFPIQGQVRLSYTDFNTSVQSSLLTNAIAEFLRSLIQSQPEKTRTFSFPDIKSWTHFHATFSTENEINLTGEILSTGGETRPFCFRTRLQLAGPQELFFASPRLELPRQQQHWDLENITINLGTDVYIQRLNFAEEKLQIQGKIQVNP